MVFASSFVLGLVALPILISAVPLTRRAISSADYDSLAFYEQFAAAAYCPNNYNSTKTSTKLVCSNDLCPQVQAADTNTVLEIPSTLITDTSGYVAVDKTNKLVVVSFRGSESWRNFATDLSFSLVSIGHCSGCFGAKGFFTAWLEVRDRVIPAVKQAAAAHPDYAILAVGHSFGATIVTHAALHLRNIGYVVDLVTYGSPRVGNENVAQYITAQAPSKGKNYRVTHKFDPIPGLPPLSLGYRQPTPGLFITTGNDAPPTANDFEVHHGTSNENPWGSSLTEDGNAHIHYFNHISGCFPNDSNIIPYSIVEEHDGAQ